MKELQFIFPATTTPDELNQCMIALASAKIPHLRSQVRKPAPLSIFIDVSIREEHAVEDTLNMITEIAKSHKGSPFDEAEFLKNGKVIRIG